MDDSIEYGTILISKVLRVKLNFYDAYLLYPNQFHRLQLILMGFGHKSLCFI